MPPKKDGRRAHCQRLAEQRASGGKAAWTEDSGDEEFLPDEAESQDDDDPNDSDNSAEAEVED